MRVEIMERALEAAQEARDRGEVPVGAVLLDPDDNLVAMAGNRTIEHRDPTAHAEILAIREACKKSGWERLMGYTLYVTLEPCTMCAVAISFARIKTVYYGAPDPKGGGVDHGARFYEQPTCHHRPIVHGQIMQAECSQLLKEFFRLRRCPETPES